jgi:hypothetical protein
LREDAGLPKSKQRSPITAAAGFLEADEAAVKSASVELLTAEVVSALLEIEPDNGVGSAMPPRLVLVTEKSQHTSPRVAQGQRDNNDSGNARRMSAQRMHGVHVMIQAGFRLLPGRGFSLI